MKTIHAITGIPGSGKTYFGKILAETLKGRLIDDLCHVEDIDVWYDAVDHIIVTDPFLVEKRYQKRFLEKVAKLYNNEPKVVWYIFENDIEQCRKNIELRKCGRKLEASLKRFHKNYHIPDGATILSVWRPGCVYKIGPDQTVTTLYKEP